MSKYVYSSSPQIKSPTTTKRIMIDVCIALLPAVIAGIVLIAMAETSRGGSAIPNTINAILLMALSCISAVGAEFVYKLCCKKDFATILKEFDFSSLVTGMLVGMNLYSTSKWYVAILASVFAIVVVKMIFGGTGKNLFNPAIAGRIFAFISFGAAFGGTMHYTEKYITGVNGGYIVGATPLQGLFGEVDSTLTNLDLLLGTGVPGCIGETCKIALLIGGLYLVIRGVLNFRWPLVYILSTGVFSVIVAWITGYNAMIEAAKAADIVINSVLQSFYLQTAFIDALGAFIPSILSGGLILGAVFMATDYVTTPNTKLGNYIYFLLCGALTAILRYAVGGEVVSFVILFMNILVPLFDMYIVRKPFGFVKAKKEAK
ncbi:MAG: RnfABCDGE type electron transport complex subunit D [Clostridia bacterium]|nr:RnfABCDGE type electron transport complex subunit D [Clostridia bacterium]